MNDHDKLNKDFYNTAADKFDKIPFSDLLPNFFLKHASRYPEGAVLDIGSGPGAFAAWISQQGYAVQCIEPANRMAEKAKERGLKVYTTTLQNFEKDEKFDIIVAISSLIHISKAEMPAQIKKIGLLLNPGGLFFVSMLIGESESLEDPTKSGQMRYFNRYSEQEFLALVQPYFNLIEKHRILSKQMNKEFMLAVYEKNSML